MQSEVFEANSNNKIKITKYDGKKLIKMKMKHLTE